MLVVKTQIQHSELEVVHWKQDSYIHYHTVQNGSEVFESFEKGIYSYYCGMKDDQSCSLVEDCPGEI